MRRNKDILHFRLKGRPRHKPCRYGSERHEAAMLDTYEYGIILATHWCECHDWYPYSPKALEDGLKAGKFNKIICCFPALAKERHPKLAPYIIGDWEGVTTTRYCQCEDYQCHTDLHVFQDGNATIDYWQMEETGVDHMGGIVPRYEPLKKAA